MPATPTDPAATAFAVRLHGLVGQGILEAARTLALATGGSVALYAVAGPEPDTVVAFCRFGDVPVPAGKADAVIVFDPAVLDRVDVLGGLRRDGFFVINAGGTVGTVARIDQPARACMLPGTDIAMRYTGQRLPRAPLLGALAALTGWISLTALTSAIEHGPADAGDVDAAREAYQRVSARVGLCQSVIGTDQTILVPCG